MAIKFDNIEAESLLNRQGELTITLTDDQGITVAGAITTPNLYLGSSSVRLSPGTNGEVGINYNTSATGSLVWYAGGTASKFNVTNAGNATFAGNVELGDSSNISMSNTAPGQLQIQGSGYTGAIALNATAMYIYHNSSLRDLVLGTNETARLTIDGNTGNATFAGTIGATNFSGSSSGTNTGDQTLPTLSSLGGASSGYLTNTSGAKLEIQNGVDGGSGYGIYMWTNTDTNWGIYMAQAGDGKSLSDETASAGIDGATAHAVRFRVNDNSSQAGFIWENSSNETLMQLNGGSEKLYTKNAIYPSNQTTDYVDSTRIQNWQTAYGWGDHGLSAQDKTDIGNLSGTNTGDQTFATLGAATRTNYTLRFQPPTGSYAGFQFMGTDGLNAGYFLVRGTSDNGVYGAEGITLVGDQGWLTLAHRYSTNKGIRFMTGDTAASTRMTIASDGDININNSLTVGTDLTVSGNIKDVDYKHAGSDLWLTKKYVRSVGITGGEIANSWVQLSRVSIASSYGKLAAKFTIHGYDDVSSGTEVIDVIYENGNSAQENHGCQWYSTDNNANLFKAVRSIRSSSSGTSNTYDLYVQMAGDWRDSFTVVAEYWRTGTNQSITFITSAGSANEPSAGSDDIELGERRWYTQNSYMYLGGSNRVYTTGDFTNNSSNWDTAYTDRNKWDGGSTGLTASTGRASLGLGTAATAAATAFATSGHNHAGVYALEYELMQSDNSDSDMHVWRKNHAMLSDGSSIGTYIIVQTNVPQDNASMGGFTLVYQDDYNSSGEGGEIKIYGYWNAESNGGFIDFRYECSNPYHTPTIEVCRNSTSGDTAFFISGEGGNYTQLIAKDLWLGYAASSATVQWGDGWTITQADGKNGYTNFDTLNRNDFAAITTNGATPSLTGGVTAAEIRTLIGAGTGNGSSDLVIGTTATTAMAGNTAFASTAQGTKADNAAPKDYESIADLGSPDAITGTWVNQSTTDWGTPRIGSSTAKYTDGTGYIQFNIPDGMKSAYLSQLQWSTGGYFHIHGIQSDGGAVLLRVVNSKNSVENTNEGNPNQHDGSTTVFAGTGLDNYSAIRITNKSGRLHLTGLGFTSSTVQGAEGMGLVHPSQLSTALSYNSLINLPTLGTAAAAATTDFATAAQGTLADSALQSLPSHNHNDLYYTESEMQHFMARALGWVSGYGGSSDSFVNYDFAEDAIILSGNGDDTTGAVHKAIRVKSGDKVRFTVMIKGSIASSSGMYIRLYQVNGNMADGKTHVSNNAGSSAVEVVEESSGDSTFEENVAISASWTNYEHTYTAPADGYVSLVVLNWAGHGNESLYIRQPDIQFEKVGDSSRLGGTAASSYLTGISSNSVGITELNVSDGTTGQVLTTNGSGTLSFSTVASGSDTNYYLDGIERSDGTNTLVFNVSGATNQSFTFGANAFNSTTIPAAEAYTAHEDTSTLSGVYGDTANGTKIDTITVDANGHITAIATGATGNMTGFFVEDGDGTEVQINNANEWKFVEGGGVDINWTDTSNGIDTDPYDLTFTLNSDLRGNVAYIGGNSNNYVQFDTTNNRIDFYAGGVFVARMESDGDLHMKGDVIAFSNIFG